MELDDLKAGWMEMDRRMERLERLESATFAQHVAGGVRAELKPLAIGQGVQLVAGVLLAFAAGSFWFDHRAAPNLLVTGLLLHLYGIAMIVAAARNLVLVARVNEGAPVLALQSRIAVLRAWRIREARWFGVVGSFMWVAMVVWAFGLLGVDIVATHPLFVGLNVLVACVCLAAFVVVSRLARAPEGAALRRARERLDEIQSFRDDV
ncbi:MAG: hypothetical protein ABWZ54_05285 [Luteibacter sp.]